MPRAARAQVATSKVIVTTDGQAWTGTGLTDADLSLTVLKRLVERSLRELTGAADVDGALAQLFPSFEDKTLRYGIKVNCVNSQVPTHPRVVEAFAHLLFDAGVPREQIIVFDRTSDELAKCGYPVEVHESIYTAVGTDDERYGYGDERVILSDGEVRLSQIVSSEIDHLINIPVLKNHEMADVTLSLKNPFGVIDRPDVLHGRSRDCANGIAELNAQPKLRDLTRLILIDATFGTYRSGLAGEPDFAPMSLIAAKDPVAADTVGQEMINTERAAEGLSPLSALHIAEAARLNIGRGQDRIDRRNIVVNPVPERSKPKSGGCSCDQTTSVR